MYVHCWYKSHKDVQSMWQKTTKEISNASDKVHDPFASEIERV